MLASRCLRLNCILRYAFFGRRYLRIFLTRYQVLAWCCRWKKKPNSGSSREWNYLPQSVRGAVFYWAAPCSQNVVSSPLYQSTNNGPGTTDIGTLDNQHRIAITVEP